MAVLTFILLIISVCTIVMSFCMTYTVSSARNSKGDFYKYDRLLKYVEPLSYAAVLISIVFGVFGFFTKTLSAVGGLKVFIIVFVLAFIADMYHGQTYKEKKTKFKSEEAKEKFYGQAREVVMNTKRNSMGYFVNDSVCPICGKDLAGIEPYRYCCPYCNLTAELTDDDFTPFE